jgi:N-acetylglutamate synthase-like GNAT family acetyltransferase
MRQPASVMAVRKADFTEVTAMLRLIERAVARGCRDHYDAQQRQAVFLSYAQSLYLEIMRGFDTVVGEVAGQMVGIAQLDAGEGRLRALFVDDHSQGGGRGAQLLGWAERRARQAGRSQIHGAMSLNAVPFYARAGFQPCEGNRWLSHAGVLVPVVPMHKMLRA